MRSGHCDKTFEGQSDDHVHGYGKGHLGNGEGNGDHVRGDFSEVGEGEKKKSHDDADGIGEEQSCQHLGEGVGEVQL